MSQNLKDILKNGEEQYNAQAWDNLSKRLDLSMPVKKINYFSGKNLLITGASALFIGSGIFFFVNQDDTKNHTQKEHVASVENKATEKKQESGPDMKTNNPLDSKVIQNNIPEENNTKDLHIGKADFKTENEFAETGYEVKNQESNPEKVSQKDNPKENEMISFKLPKFENSYCLNEEISIYNPNKSKSYLLNDAKVVVAILSGESATKVKIMHAGTYYLQYPQGLDSKATEQVFYVKEAKHLEFSYDNEIIYEKGIPYIALSTTDFSKGVNWSTNKGTINEQADKAKLSAFRKGTYDVSLNFTDENKCEVKKTQSIEIKEDYNLLAVSGFDPSDLDSRKTGFMPFALTKRNVSFNMFILDPETGKIVFTSNSPDNSWDGIDKNTGQMVKYEKDFIWKVSLTNPEPGEKAEYTGKIKLQK